MLDRQIRKIPQLHVDYLWSVIGWWFTFSSEQSRGRQPQGNLRMDDTEALYLRYLIESMASIMHILASYLNSPEIITDKVLEDLTHSYYIKFFCPRPPQKDTGKNLNWRKLNVERWAVSFGGCKKCRKVTDKADVTLQAKFAKVCKNFWLQISEQTRCSFKKYVPKSGLEYLSLPLFTYILTGKLDTLGPRFFVECVFLSWLFDSIPSVRMAWVQVYD